MLAVRQSIRVTSYRWGGVYLRNVSQGQPSSILITAYRLLSLLHSLFWNLFCVCVFWK